MSEHKDERDIDEILASIDKMLAEKDSSARQTDERKENVEQAARDSEQTLGLSSSAAENIQPNAKLQPFESLDATDSSAKNSVIEDASEHESKVPPEFEPVATGAPRQRIVLTEDNLEPSAQESLPLWAAQAADTSDTAKEEPDTKQESNNFDESSNPEIINDDSEFSDDEEDIAAASEEMSGNEADAENDNTDIVDEAVDAELSTAIEPEQHFDDNEGWDNIELIEPDIDTDSDDEAKPEAAEHSDSDVSDMHNPDNNNLDATNADDSDSESAVPNIDASVDDGITDSQPNQELIDTDNNDDESIRGDDSKKEKDEFEDVFQAIANDDTITFDINEAMDQDTVYDIQVLDKELVEAFVHDVVQEDDNFKEAANLQQQTTSDDLDDAKADEEAIAQREETTEYSEPETAEQSENEAPFSHKRFNLANDESYEAGIIEDVIVEDTGIEGDAESDESETIINSDNQLENQVASVGETIATVEAAKGIEHAVAKAIDNDENISLNPDELDTIIELISDDVRIKINQHLQQILPELISDVLLEHLASPDYSDKHNGDNK